MTDDSLQSFVNVKPVIVADAPDAHQVWLDIGVQHFQIGSYWETKEEAEFSAKMLRNAISNIKGPSVDEMVNRFLGWKLPEDFAPDHGISFVRNEFHNRHGMPTGTNLLHAGQAKAMFQYCLAWQAALSAQTEARDGEVFTYTRQPDNIGAWRIGEACRSAADDPKCGDPIDRGLILLLKLHEKGYGIVSVPKRVKPNE